MEVGKEMARSQQACLGHGELLLSKCPLPFPEFLPPATCIGSEASPPLNSSPGLSPREPPREGSKQTPDMSVRPTVHPVILVRQLVLSLSLGLPID